jgi:tetratricopeptide (TPR) repeat protein
MLKLFCYSLLLASIESSITTNQNINWYGISQLTLLDEFYDIAQKSRLSQTLEMINEIDDSQVKVMLLNNLALSYAKSGDVEKAEKILEQSLSITEKFEDITLKITAITEIAHQGNCI